MFIGWNATFLQSIDAMWGNPGALTSLRADSFENAVQEITTELTAQGYRVEPTDLWLEGGDILGARDDQGEPLALVGDNTVWLSMVSLHLRGAFESTYADRLKQERESLDTSTDVEDVIQDFINRLSRAHAMYTDPVVQSGMLNILARRSWVAGEEGARQLLEQFIAQSAIVPADYPQQTDTQKRSHALDIWAKMNVTATLIEETLGMINRVLFIRSAFYHLDYFLRPLKPGVILMPDPNELLGIPGIAGYNQTGMKQALNHVDGVLKNAGLATQYVPGATRMGNDPLDLKTKFLNGIMGSVKGACGTKQYFITTGASPELNQYFRANMQTLGVEVHFIQKLNIPDEPLDTGGFHCATLEESVPIDVSAR